MVVSRIDRLRRLARIAARTSRFLASFAWRRAIARDRLAFDRDEGPRMLLEYLSACQGLFAKVGQLLAGRVDVLPEAYAERLATLWDQMAPVPFASIRNTLEQELHQPCEALFAELDPTPVSAASVAQVHKARLQDGDRVAVKVMRPDAERIFEADLRFMRTLAWLLGGVSAWRHLALGRFVEEFARLMRRELDFVNEAIHLEELHGLMKEDRVGHYAPRVYPKLSARRVLTMEWLEGDSIKVVRDAVRTRNTAELERLAARGILPKETARRLHRSLTEQFCVHRVYHADPHPANLIVLNGGTLAYVDFGIVARLDEMSCEKLRRLFRHIAHHRIHASCEAFVAAVEPLPPIPLGRFESELKGILADWIGATKSQCAPAEQKSYARLLLRALDLMRRYEVPVPWTVMALFRALIIMDFIVHGLDPEFDSTRELRRFFDEGYSQIREDALNLATQKDLAQSLLEATLQLPSTLESVSVWTRSRLPRIGRTQGQDYTRLERGVSLGLRYASTMLALGGALLLVLTVPGMGQTLGLEGGAMAALAARHGPLAGLAGLLFSAMLHRMARRMDEPL